MARLDPKLRPLRAPRWRLDEAVRYRGEVPLATMVLSFVALFGFVFTYHVAVAWWHVVEVMR